MVNEARVYDIRGEIGYMKPAWLKRLEYYKDNPHNTIRIVGLDDYHLVESDEDVRQEAAAKEEEKRED